MTSELLEMIERCREHVWTEEEKREQAISFAYGNVKLHNPTVTRETVAEEYDKIQREKKRNDVG